MSLNTSARIKARSLGIADDSDDGKDHKETKTQRETKETVRLLGRDIPVAKAKGGALVAAADGRSPPSPAAARSYVERAFGERLAEVRAAMEELATSLDPEELNRIGFRLYERFRPEIPAGARGWGAKGELYLDRIRDAADPG